MSYREREKSRSRPGSHIAAQNGNKMPSSISTVRPVTVNPQGFHILTTTSNFSRSRPKKEKLGMELLDTSMTGKSSLNNNPHQLQQPQQQQQQQRQQVPASTKQKKTTLSNWTGNRPRTSGEPTKIVHFSGVVDRFHPGVPTSQEKLQDKDSSPPCKRKHKINEDDRNMDTEMEITVYDGNCQPPGATVIKNRIHMDENGNSCTTDNDNTELYNFQQNSHNQQQLDVLHHNLSTCDLEFINKEFKYDDDAMSVIEFQAEDEESYLCQIKSEEVEEEQESSRANGDSGTVESRGLISLMNSIISFPNLHKVNNLLNGAAKVGETLSLVQEQILKAGTGITQIFSDNEVTYDEFITCNGYKIHTIGKNLCINSLILRGVKSQSFRIIVQTKEYQGSPKEANKISKIDPKIIVTENKWTLLYGCYEEEGTGLLEIEVPSPKIKERINGINIEGPCHGLIFIDVPKIK